MKLHRLRGAEGFHTYYQRELGERAQSIFASLLGSDELAPARLNLHSSLNAREGFSHLVGTGVVDNVFQLPEGADAKQCDEQGLRLFYFMDPASVVAARALPLAEARRVLDMCAAPGGKSLVLSESLSESAELVCNDRSPMRRKRLTQVIRDYLPRGLRERVFVKGMDGRRIGLDESGAFDAILLDAPCSSEAHVLHDEKALAQWSELRVKRLAKEQYALITSALNALQPGGHLLYSTCALAPLENDGVIAHLIKKARHPVEILQPPLIIGERTEYGIQIWPDKSSYGPIFYCLMRKI